VAKVPLLRMKIVKRSDDTKGFVVLPRRWVVERTLSWFGRKPRLAKDFANRAETLATFVTLASIQLALRRLVRAYVVDPTDHRFPMRDDQGRQIGL
jgi:Transposase DDE domain